MATQFPTGIAILDRRIEPEARVDGMTPCWIWQSTISVAGYGVVSVSGRQWKAHRLAYTLIVGEMADDMVTDHLCRVRPCVNPDHLEPVTNAENVMRGESAPARFARATHCKRGHEFTPDNTYKNGKNGRSCITCHKARQQRVQAVARANRPPRVSTRGQNVTHGKGGTYRSYGCRCEPCTTANTQDGLRYQARRKAQESA